MVVTTSLDLARTRLATFRVRYDHEGNPISEYWFPREPLREGELEDAITGLGIPRPTIPANAS
jgi:hypothetical protein